MRGRNTRAEGPKKRMFVGIYRYKFGQFFDVGCLTDISFGNFDLQ